MKNVAFKLSLSNFSQSYKECFLLQKRPLSKSLILEIFQNFKCPNIFKDQIHGK